MPRSPLTTGARAAVAAILLLSTTAATTTGSVAGVRSAHPAVASQESTALAGDVRFSVPSGTFQGTLSVSLSTSVENAEIRYTTDGQAPGPSSTAYTGTPLRLSGTTQLRAQAFVAGKATGDLSTALYLASSISTVHDIPVIVIDDYGRGKPGREYVDAAVMEFQPSDGLATASGTPTLASRAGIHLRGQSSAMFDKAPYRLELRDNADDDAKLPLLGMPADGDWVLRGPFSDKSLIREAFVYDLGREMGIASPRYTFCEVYLNVDDQIVEPADYMGVYAIVETIEISSARLDLAKLHDDDIAEPEVRGGYIFKFEWLAAEEPILECTGNASTCWNDLEVDDPSSLQPEQEAWLTQYLQRFHDMLHSPGFADPTTGYDAWIDVDSFVDQVILNELSRNMDAYTRSVYFYKDRDGEILAGPLWDYDLTFGVGGYFENANTAGWQYQQTRQPIATDWFTILLSDPAFVDAVQARWQELRRGLLSTEQMNARITALTAPLTAAAQRNFTRWPNLTTRLIGPFITPTDSTWQAQVQQMQNWLTQRAAWLDSDAGWGSGGDPGPTPEPTPDPSQSCTATYVVSSQWQGGFQGDVTVMAGRTAISGWTVTMTFADGQTVTQSWSASLTTSGSTVTAKNLSWNGSLAAGATTGFGFAGTWNGTNTTPTVACTAG
jgi:hypothetical protein